MALMFEAFEKVHLSVFPELADRPALHVDMDKLYALHRPQRDGKSIYLDPTLTDRFLAALHKTQNVAYSFGGYLEDRGNLWSGSYMDEDRAVHLGIDVNAPAGTLVAPAHASKIAKIIHDPDQDGGWGSVVFFELEKPIGNISHFLYAHLSPEMLVNVGEHVEAGQGIGHLGRPHENGGWYEHLHIQALTPQAWALAKDRNDMGAFDGYDALPDGREHHLSPNPAPLLFPK